MRRLLALTLLAFPLSLGSHTAHPHTACASVSGICAPGEGTTNDYAWHDAGSGGWFDEFTGTTLDTSVWYAQDGGSPGDGSCSKACDDTWSAMMTRVGGGEVAMSTSCVATRCLSGGIGQQSSGAGSHPWMADGDVAVTFEVTGFPEQAGEDNVLQLGSYPTWPPEIDYMENGTGSSSTYHQFLHCEGSPIAQEKTNLLALDLGEWQTFEVDWTPSTITIYDTPVATGVTTEVNRFDKPVGDIEIRNDPDCYLHWPADPAGAMGSFMQSQIVGSSSPTLASTTLDVDWFAERAS